jgi:hypothetical protein
MKTLCTSIAVATGALALLAASAPALAQEPNHCSKSADFALQACRQEAQAEYRNRLAICRNLSQGGERNSCREEADEELEETLRAADDSCEAQREARGDACALLGEDRYDPEWQAENFVDPDTIGATVAPNPYLSLVPGRTAVIRAGADLEEWVIEYVTSDTEEIDGVLCRTVVDLEFAPEEGDEVEEPARVPALRRTASIEVDGVTLELNEYTDDWYAQDLDGNVWYCGELSRQYENESLVDLEGSFRAGEDGDKPGILVSAMPMAGDVYRQEWSVNNAEDYAQVISTAGGPDVEVEGFECNDGCLETEEATPLEPGHVERKYYLTETGFVLAEEVVEAGEQGEREELICVGKALEDCVTDQALLDELCSIAPNVFCPEVPAPTVLR